MTDTQKVLIINGTHAVGNLSNNGDSKTVNGGATVSVADIDNFTIVELGFDANGERICKQLSSKANKGYLIATPEFRALGEPMTQFYNAIDDKARIVVLEPAYTRFDTSAFSFNAGQTALSNGQVAHFDVATKKYIISASATPHADYAGSKAKFVVVGSESDGAYVYTCGLPTVKLEVIEA